MVARPLLPPGGDEAHMPGLAGWGWGEGLRLGHQTGDGLVLNQDS